MDRSPEIISRLEHIETLLNMLMLAASVGDIPNKLRSTLVNAVQESQESRDRIEDAKARLEGKRLVNNGENGETANAESAAD